MKDISEKVSYLQGLTEGLNISDGSPQGKIISGMLGVLEEITDEIINMRNEFEDFKEYVESIDDDLFDLEENVNNENADSDYIEVKCSNCGEQLYFSSDVMDDDDVIEIICPNCNEVVFINDGSFDYEPAYINDKTENNDSQIENPSPS